MATLATTDTRAFAHLVALSQRQNRKLRDIVEEVILTGAIPAPPSPQPLPTADPGPALRPEPSRDDGSSDAKAAKGHELQNGSEPRNTSFRLRLDTETSIVKLIGDVDLAVLPEMARVENIICDHTTAAIAVDCGDLTFIDCAGLGELLSWNNLANRHSKVLSFRRVPRPLRMLLELSGLHGALTVTDYVTAPRDDPDPGYASPATHRLIAAAQTSVRTSSTSGSTSVTPR